MTGAALRLVQELELAGVALWLEGDALRWRAPRGAVTEARQRELGRRKADVVALLAWREQQACVVVCDGPPCADCGRLQTWRHDGRPVCRTCAGLLSNWGSGLRALEPRASAVEQVLEAEHELLGLGWTSGELWSRVGWYSARGLVTLIGPGGRLAELGAERVVLVHENATGEGVRTSAGRSTVAAAVPARWWARPAGARKPAGNQGRLGTAPALTVQVPDNIECSADDGGREAPPSGSSPGGGGACGYPRGHPPSLVRGWNSKGSV